MFIIIHDIKHLTFRHINCCLMLYKHPHDSFLLILEPDDVFPLTNGDVMFT